MVLRSSKRAKVTEAKVLLIGCSQSDGFIQVNDSRVEKGGDRGKEARHIRLVGNIF